MSNLGRRFRVLTLAISFSGLTMTPAAAGDETGDEIVLGPVQTFRDENTARAACQPDTVIWADRRTGYYYPKFMPEYGKSPDGAFACFQAAQRADYWGFGTGDSMSSRRSRKFPVSPDAFCDYKVDKASGKGFCAKPGV